MNHSIVRWLTVPDIWDFTDDIKPDAENPKKNRTASSFAVSTWDVDPDTWEHDYVMSNKLPALHKINLSKINIWEGEEGLIKISFEVTDDDGEDIQYKVLINNEEVIPLTNFYPTLAQIEASIPITRFNEKENLLELIVIDELGLETYFNYIIKKENRDTFTFKRVFDFKEDYITDENIEVIYGRGLTLKEIGTGEVNIEIPTEGKSKISNIVIEGGEDKEKEEVTIEREMTYLNDLGEGKVYESRLLTEYTDIVDIEVDSVLCYSLIKSNNKYYTYQNNEFIEVEPTVENFKENFVDLSQLTTPNENGIKPYKLLDNPSIVTYTEDEEIPILSQTVLASTKVRFLVSKDKTNYQVYRNSEWITIDKDNILEQGMTKLELESIPQEAWAEWVENEAHKHSFDILVGVYSENPNTPLMRSITVNYAENESPIIINAYIEPDTIHNEFATLKAHVKDYEGDKISFKVFIKRAGSDEFIQVSPLESWYDRGTSEAEITQAFNFSYFNPGENEIKLVVKDERGAEAEWVGKIILSNTNPTITLTYNDFSMKATIGDDDSDDIAYRILINGNLIFDYTNFVPTKAQVNYAFDTTKLKFGEENIITLEVKDTHGGRVEQDFTVIGTYRGLMFKNEEGKYFVDSKGEVLMDLLFDKTLIGGQISETKKVILENRHEFPISNVVIEAENPNFVDGAVLELSETEMPFNPQSIIKVIETLPSIGTKDFYVRVKTDRTAHQGSYFYIKSTASSVIE